MTEKIIRQLIPDIYSLVSTRGGINAELIRSLSDDLGVRLGDHFGEAPRQPTLRLSKMGPRCPRALWYEIHRPELSEALPPWAQIKYGFGHILEALCITLAKAAGHEVTGEQDELVVDGIVGHRDCVIDGCVVDVKSTTSQGFGKFKAGLIEQDDPFGYLDQLDGYLVGSLGDPLVRDKDHGYLLVIDKQLGHMHLHEHTIREQSIRERIASYKSTISRRDPPECTCETRAIGQSGNIGLATKPSYSLYKFCCFPNLRTFLYSDGPVYLTKVVRKPDVTEVDKYGKVVYN